MKDLASRLRKHAEEVLDPGYPYYGTPEMVREAASEIERLRLTDAEREAVDRVRIAFRDMDHNDMTMQQIEDYEAICDLLERTK